jgi:hypothetical protein
MFINKFKSYFKLYLNLLWLFGIFFLYEKHIIGNDSTISEWMINYQGGFIKRGVIGEICFQVAQFFNIKLRFAIFLFQSIIYSVYIIVVYKYLKNVNINYLILFVIFSPIFILYPVAEIEVLGRKELFIFVGFLLFLNFSSNKYKDNVSLLYNFIVLPILCLIWEPVIFFFPFFLGVLISRFENLNKKNIFKIFVSFLPATALCCFFIFNPISEENHKLMVNSFNEMGESCYMSCGLLLSKSTLYQQFQANFNIYSFTIFLRYFLIIIIGFGPIFLLSFYSKFKNKNYFLFKKFKNLLFPILTLVSPLILLFAMGSDWGRWVNISYTFTILFYFFLIKNNVIIYDQLKIDHLYKRFIKKEYVLIIIFIFFAFSWNPKTAISGDVGSFPIYRIPYKIIKMLL